MSAANRALDNPKTVTSEAFSWHSMVGCGGPLTPLSLRDQDPRDGAPSGDPRGPDERGRPTRQRCDAGDRRPVAVSSVVTWLAWPVREVQHPCRRALHRHWTSVSMKWAQLSSVRRGRPVDGSKSASHVSICLRGEDQVRWEKAAAQVN